MPTGKVETGLSIGKTIKIDGKTIYPVIQTSSTLSREEKTSFGAWISPVAIVIVERTRKYVIPLTEKTFTLDQLLETIPALKEKLVGASKQSSKPKKKRGNQRETNKTS